MWCSILQSISRDGSGAARFWKDTRDFDKLTRGGNARFLLPVPHTLLVPT